MRRGRRVAGILAGCALLLAACGDDSGDSGAIPAVLSFTFDAASDVDGAALEDAARERLDGIGIVVEAVDLEGPGELTVAIEDDRLRELSVDLLTRQGVLRFRPVLAIVPGASPDRALTDPAQDLADQPVTLPEETADGAVAATYDLGPALVDGAAVETATVEQAADGSWQIALTVPQAALEELDRAAGLCFAKGPECPTGELAVVVDGSVLSAPLVTQATYDAIVLGTSLEEVAARRLATVLQAGPLPVALTPSAD